MLSDAIVALATPPGRSAIAVVRLSGDDALEIAGRVVDAVHTAAPRTATLATFRAADGTPIDRGLVTVFRAPHSYTGDDLVELSCHGGLAVPARLLAALQAAGARPAAPGEFTRRAVLNGKLDLVQAEAVGDLIDATAPAQARTALAQLEGGLSRRLGELREALVEVNALLGYEIDFPEEDDGPVPRDRIRGRLDNVGERIDRLLATSSAGERLREGALVVLAGRPNAGKSSLFNALLGNARALVTAVPGTTRDAIEVPVDVAGWPVRLIDTAGLWDSADPIDQLGIAVTRRWLTAADLVLVCVEGSRALGEDERELAVSAAALVVRTKSDLWTAPALAPATAPAPPAAAAGFDAPVPVSALSGSGLDTLRSAIAFRLFGDRAVLADLEPVLTRERHRAALAAARDALRAARPHLVPGGDAVLAAHHVRLATTALDELLGAVDIEEVLGRVFASFCVGK
ncbi:MAG: tRNA uridine-5-carboxymethylaminomethyl(34) synthesis GTPase MnmE [Gemmatimonadota bacterium]